LIAGRNHLRRLRRAGRDERDAESKEVQGSHDIPCYVVGVRELPRNGYATCRRVEVKPISSAFQDRRARVA
jgi:hypothetical protein